MNKKISIATIITVFVATAGIGVFSILLKPALPGKDTPPAADKERKIRLQEEIDGFCD